MDINKKIIDVLSNKDYSPMTDEAIIKHLGVERSQIGKCISELDKLEHEGVIFKTKKNKYVLPNRINLVVGTLKMNRKGFGFVLPESDKKGDVYIASSEMNGAMNGDKVAVRLMYDKEGEKSREGEIIKIIKRENYEVVGTFEGGNKFGFVIPNDSKLGTDIFIPQENINGARTGDKVVSKILVWPEKRRSPEGKIIEILGKEDEAGTDIAAIIRQYKLSETFPQKVRTEADNISIEIKQEEILKRKDYRAKSIITIDGADAKDLDDAVSVEKVSNGNYLLGVHIADVSYYVKEKSFLDKEALKRGCSVYLINKVLPMLPENLSNGVCSLNPNSDRLTLSIEMEVDSLGRVISHDIFNSIINSKERMVYTDVSDIIENEDEELINKYRHIYDDLLLMKELAEILNRSRDERGSIDFDFDEAFIHLNEQGIPTKVETAERRTANRIIEEFMLKANETIAEHFHWLEVPFIYRVHEEPEEDKISEFKKFIYNFGYVLKGNPDIIRPKMLQEITKKIKGKREENVISTVMLRSLKKASYSPQCHGHFGLAADFYCHFTSPIRRYPDLMIHRIIKETIEKGQMSGKRIKQLDKIVEEASQKSSEAEKIAENIEREVEDLKKAEYMSGHIGEIFSGIISGVTSFGIFVELDNTIEGLVRISSIDDDYYIYDKENYKLVGERTKRTFSLGEEVTIKVVGVNIPNHEIDFEIE